MRAFLLIYLCLMATSCMQHSGQLLSPNTRPYGSPIPKHKILQKALDFIDENKVKEAKEELDRSDTKTKHDELWKLYLSSLVNLKESKFQRGQSLLESCHQFVMTDIQSDPELVRIAGLCLKKLGWLYRKDKNYPKAFYYHSYRYYYLMEHGSSFEIHDALISLDVDAYFLKDFQLSKSILTKSISYAHQIEDNKQRFKGIGISYNNLAGTLYALHQFEAALDAIGLSLNNWSEYEARAGTEEFKLVWAYFAKGDVYESWLRHLKKIGKEHTSQKKQALAAYQKSLNMAKTRKMSSQNQLMILNRIKGIEALK